MRKLANISHHLSLLKERKYMIAVNNSGSRVRPTQSFIQQIFTSIYYGPSPVLGVRYMGEGKQDKEDPSALMQFTLGLRSKIN